MKLNELDFDKLSDSDLIQLCLKYKICRTKRHSKYNKQRTIRINKKYLEKKLQVYGQKK